MSDSPFLQFILAGFSRGGFEVDDVLAAVLPLMREVATVHEMGSVAELRGSGGIAVHEDLFLGLARLEGIAPSFNRDQLGLLQAAVGKGIEVVGERSLESDALGVVSAMHNLDVGLPGDEITRPVYLPDHVSWEHAVGHHDALTDIFSMGMLLASLTLGLDFNEPEDLEAFANSRRNLFSLAPRAHPVLVMVIVGMTELNRGRRSQDLVSLIRTLETYRDQPVGEDLNRLAGLEMASKGGRRKIIQTHLRDRLFEVSRRNRLLYFKSTQGTLNLTTASVPLVLDHRNIRPEQLLYWHDSVANEVKACRPVGLQKWLRVEEAPYLPAQLDKLISEARRSRAEYGFSQLRLVIAFLRWNNLKELPDERIHSPLLLLPVDLVKKKGVKDQYTLEAQGSEAEVNPALRHHLKQLYDLDLPESIDLRETTMAQFHETVSRLIHATEPGVILSLTDKPKIQLIHEKARSTMDSYRRRMARKKVVEKRAESISYSYDREDFRPLGLEMFQKLVLPTPLPLRDAAGAPPAFRTPFIVPETGTDRKKYQLVEEAEGNPYAWEFDLCALTLANFNYRKMTLVRDYANLIDHDVASVAFDRVFSIEAKEKTGSEEPVLPPSDQYLIIAADATQVGAIAKARQGDSLIIQGPPGTGKSQTITNLIADYVARGKRVLFVCEKRAAIDVVFHRLRQQGLDELCCLIHDSQTDKKEFILNLKQTYEQWLGGADQAGGNDAKRSAALNGMESELEALQNHVAQMETIPDLAGVDLTGMLRRLIELRGTHNGSACPALGAETEEMLPHYREWLLHGDKIVRLGEVMLDLGAEPVFANHPVRFLGEDVITSETPLAGLNERLDFAEQALGNLVDALLQTDLPAEHRDTAAEVGQLLDYASRLKPLADRGLLGLLDSKSARSKDFVKLAIEHAAEAKKLETAAKKTANWKDKLPPEDTASALALAPKVSGLLGFLNSGWWKLRKVLQARYDFSKHAVTPSWEQVLSDLAAEHAAESALAEVAARFLTDYASADPLSLSSELKELLDPAASPAVVALRDSLLASGDGGALVERLAALAAGFHKLHQEVKSLVHDADAMSLTALEEAIREIREEAEVIPEMLPALRDLAGMPMEFRVSLRKLALTVEQFEAACARKTLEQLYREDRVLQRFDSHVLQQKLDRLASSHRRWLELNAGWIRSGVRGRFLEHVQVAGQSATVLTADQKIFKKSYTTGRRELEHEFGKTMRYKSIRELAAGDSGAVVRDLKPIWLMSPLSVSDTLPLDVGLFDVVIFDEASQIPVEDAVPAAYRAPQVIVVGDEMQLPPTAFFSSGGDAEDEILVEEEGESVSVMMDADSFLTQCARNLPSTLLAWHYRSRYESLISFSNAAFYGGELYTIPDRQLSAANGGEMIVDSLETAGELVPGILAKPVSFVRCEGAVYDNRRNAKEAAVVARLVRSLLLSESGLSIGVAAFSETQQGEIESALDALAAEDTDFSARLEAEYVREEDDQFCGLFVKNLENVQGDERDIIIMSVCYAPDASGKMRMNFGPINQRGGEKRLNVIFSRARHHMVLVSTIRHTNITNDYNDGANALKGFLKYAECLSRGESAVARQVLDGLNPLKRNSLVKEDTGSLVAAQIASALTTRGWVAETRTGQSRFRCDVSVRAAGSPRHQLAILVDGGNSMSVLERFHTRPGILRAFGWQVAVVMTKDWWHEPAAVLEKIERQMRREAADEVPFEEDDTDPAEDLAESPETERSFSEGLNPTVELSSQDDAMTSAERRFEYRDAKSSKFWSVSQDGASLVIRFGRIGTNGQVQQKDFTDNSRAKREQEKLIRQKLSKDYAEVTES